MAREACIECYATQSFVTDKRARAGWKRAAAARRLARQLSGLTQHARRQLRRVLCGVWRNLDDEVGVQGCGDPVQERDGRDDTGGFEA